MSGAEIIGLISGIVSLVDASIKVYHAARNTGDLPPSFADAASRLPLVRDTLITAQHGLAETPPESGATREALRSVLDACAEKARALDEIFLAVMAPPGASRLRRYRLAVKSMSKSGRVEKLTAGILADLQVLAGNHAIRAATREEIEMLLREATAPQIVDGRGRIRGGEGASVMFRNTGWGHQVVHSGDGDQNLNTGRGSQVNGVFHGPFHFTPR
ncbi:hypothetical protein VTK73DRAFT_8659 [Phialemonium thermophilum]|uniref:NACHT-NTPase and P-loop NTPases N-terminal domain-containing protein n=1 Tax=Phialemonium thermophilum TaxID=223376 RepID=A0ABR3XNT5_9PEZI